MSNKKKHKPRVIFLSQTLYPDTNAAASRVYERLKFFEEKKQHCLVISQKPEQLFENGTVEDGFSYIKVFRLPRLCLSGKGLFVRALRFIWFSAYSFCFLLFKAKKGDLIVASSPQYLNLEVAKMISKLKKLYFIAEIADLWPDTIADLGVLSKKSYIFKIWKKCEQAVYKSTDAVVGLTPGISESIKPYVQNEGKVHTICNGYDESLWNPLVKEMKKERCFKIGYYGAIGRAQSIETLVNAAKLIQDQGVEGLSFVIGGRGENFKKIKDLIASEGITNVALKEPVEKIKMPTLWSELDLCVVPLRNIELFKGAIPTKITECIGMELPVLLSSPYSDASKLLDAEGFGRTVDAESPEKLAKAILELKEDKDLMLRFKNNLGLKKNKYTRRAQADELYKLILNVWKEVVDR